MLASPSSCRHRMRPTPSPIRSTAACSTSATAIASTGERGHGEPGGKPRRASSTAARRGLMPRGSRMFDPARYLDRPVRPAPVRGEHAVGVRPGRRPGDEHDGPPRRRHRAAARAPRHRALAGVGRVVGDAARLRVRRGVPDRVSARWSSSASSGRPAPTSSGSRARWAGCSRRSGSASATPCRPPTVTATWPRRTPGCSRTPIRPCTDRRPWRGASGRTPTWRPRPGTPTTPATTTRRSGCASPAS